MVDDIDFPNAMKVVDYLVENRAPIEIAGDTFQPGYDLPSAMAAEAEMESRMGRIIENCSFKNPRLSGLLEVARGPRSEYSRWLEAQLGELGPGEGSNPEFAMDVAELHGHLLTVIEQAMVHAFVHFHHGRNELADAAWHTSGAAMMQLTKFVAMCAARNAAMIVKAMPSPTVEYDTDSSLELDAEIASRCAVMATEAAAGSRDEKVVRYCRDLESYYSALSKFKAGATHPAESTNPPAFSSFEATLRRFGLR